MTICVGRPIIEKLASEGAWASEDGEALVAASELFGNSPYAEIERLRDALAQISNLREGAEKRADDYGAAARIARDALAH